MALHSRTSICLFLLLPALLLSGCDNNKPRRGGVNYGPGSVDLSDISSYRSDSPYSGLLKRCAAISYTYQSCPLGTLPLLGQESSAPTVDEIMARVAVSHQWMGDNFRLALEVMPADIRLLLRSVTAIVIDADIQPAFYDPLTGAIYLDPSYLWLTVAEKRTLPPRADFRDDFGSDLQFVDLWRYVKQNDWAWPYFDLADESERALDDIVISFSRLMYHELAHANDMAPADRMGSFNPDETIYQAISNISDQWLSQRLIDNYPLNAEALKQIAQVKFLGHPSTAEQRGYSPADIGLLFQGDGADMLYNYTTQHEDFALLFEETMMKYHFDAELDIAFSDNLDGSLVCNDYQVAWGQRNRIATALVLPRAEYAAAQLLPDIDWVTFFDTRVGTTIQMAGGGWCENLNLATTATAASRTRVPLNEKGEALMPLENLRPPH